MKPAKKGAFRTLTKIRLKEARLLFKNGCWSGAFYLAGYSVECALKARIAEQLSKFDIPQVEAVKGAYTHNLVDLISVAGLKKPFDQEIQNKNGAFLSNWDTLAGTDGWSAEKRYDESITKAEAEKLINAITDRNNGVLQWIKKN